MLPSASRSTLKIEFRSLDEFEIEYKQEIIEESEVLIQDHLWWNEPFTLYDQIKFPLYLTGESNLILDGLSDDYAVRRTIEREDDIFMAMGDYLKIVAVLESLGAKHQLDWHLFITDSTGREITIGVVENGRADEAVIQYVVDTLSRYDMQLEQVTDTTCRNEIYSKYFDEDDQPIFED